MYSYNQYNKYKEHYVPKAKSIYIKEYSCKWNPITTQFDFSNYKHVLLYFNLSKRLLEVLITRNRWKVGDIKKTSFLYNHRNQPVLLVTSNYKSNEFVSIVNIYYDLKNRISCESIDYRNYLDQRYLHSYLGNSHTVTHYFDDEDNIENLITETFDLKGNMTEHKVYKNGEDLTFFEKYIYSDDGILLFTFSLDEDGNVYSETQHRGNFSNTIYRKDSNNVSIDEIQFQYNDKGHWIQKSTIRNGSLKFIEERSIKYYD
jgi:hypothetical protein